MDPLLVPYCFNILVLVPVGLLTLLGGATGNRWVFHGKFPESAGVRTILGVPVDVDPGGVVSGPVLSHGHGAAADPGHLQVALARGVRGPSMAHRAWRRSSLGVTADVSRHRGELSVGDPVGRLLGPS